MKVKIQVVIENDEGTVEDECVKKSGVRRGMAFEINVDSRLPNSPLRRKPNVLNRAKAEVNGSRPFGIIHFVY